MKVAPLLHEIREERSADLLPVLVHTGQHYDYEMSRVFFEELDIPEPDHFLNAGSGSHAEQTSKVMLAFEDVCLQEKPAVVVVVGDVNSTMACAITAKKLLIRVAHVEAGLRSRDMTMPEEINRIVTDSIADYLFVTEQSGLENLLREGRSREHIHFVGNVMIDTLHRQLKKLGEQPHPPEEVDPYAVVTLHRPSNVDREQTLRGIISALSRISQDMKVIFPIHPRTKKQIDAFGLISLIRENGIQLVSPMPYMSFLRLWKGASLVLTDSGGLQEETTALGVPCFTIRENTERPVTIDEGTNTLVGTTEQGILSAYEAFRNGQTKRGRIPHLWDGHTAKRIIDILTRNII